MSYALLQTHGPLTGPANLVSTPGVRFPDQKLEKMGKTSIETYKQGTGTRSVKWEAVAGFVIAAALVGLGAFAIMMASVTLGAGAIALGVAVFAYGVYKIRDKASHQDKIIIDAAVRRLATNQRDDELKAQQEEREQQQAAAAAAAEQAAAAAEAAAKQQEANRVTEMLNQLQTQMAALQHGNAPVNNA